MFKGNKSEEGDSPLRAVFLAALELSVIPIGAGREEDEKSRTVNI